MWRPVVVTASRCKITSPLCAAEWTIRAIKLTASQMVSKNKARWVRKYKEMHITRRVEVKNQKN
jgi:hypothetical protein